MSELDKLAEARRLTDAKIGLAAISLAEGSQVVGVVKVTGPNVERDIDIARSHAEELIFELKFRGLEIDPVTEEALLIFSEFVGAACIRHIFEPSEGASIEVRYQQGSELDQGDAVKLVARSHPYALEINNAVDGYQPPEV